MRPDSEDLKLAFDFALSQAPIYQQLMSRDQNNQTNLALITINFRGINQANGHLTFDILFNYNYHAPGQNVLEDIIARIEINQNRNRFFIGWQRIHIP